jgi:hypothetical protein
MALTLILGFVLVAVTAIYFFVFRQPEVQVPARKDDTYSVEVKDKDGA